MNRRSFIQAASGIFAGLVLDPEKLLWIPGKKTIFIPSPLVEAFPNLDAINVATLKWIRDSHLVDQVFRMNTITRIALENNSVTDFIGGPYSRGQAFLI